LTARRPSCPRLSFAHLDGSGECIRGGLACDPVPWDFLARIATILPRPSRNLVIICLDCSSGIGGPRLPARCRSLLNPRRRTPVNCRQWNSPSRLRSSLRRASKSPRPHALAALRGPAAQSALGFHGSAVRRKSLSRTPSPNPQPSATILSRVFAKRPDRQAPAADPEQARNRFRH